MQSASDASLVLVIKREGHYRRWDTFLMAVQFPDLELCPDFSVVRIDACERDIFLQNR